MRTRARDMLAGAGIAFMASTATAQTALPAAAQAVESIGLEEIIVTARRRDESAQDVPTTISAVTGADIEKLNIRRFEDIATVVPGLAMATNGNGIGATASVRGVNYDVNASGNNGTIEFYLNDAPISAGNLFQAVYDIQQVELLRGPQGTLRGRASPSGSMTVTTRRPDLSEIGGYASATGTDIGGYNGQGAFSFPIVADKLAMRIAGVYDVNEGNRVTSVLNSADPEFETKSARATILYEPTDSLSFVLTAQKTELDAVAFDQVVSQQEIVPGAAVTNSAGANPFAANVAPPAYIRLGDRLAVADNPRTIDNDYENYNLQVQWAFAGQKLNYVVARNDQQFIAHEPGDIGDYFSSLSAGVFQGFGRDTNSRAKTTAHELRLGSEERIGIFSYIVGAFYQDADFPTDLLSVTPVALPPSAQNPSFTQFLSVSPISRRGGNEEKSVFANLTAQVTDSTELSGGVRYIEYDATGSLVVSGVVNPLAAEDSSFTTTIYNVTVKQTLSDDLMAYANVGTSWRPGIYAVGDFSLNQSPLERSFLILPPEESTSYELGLKFSALEKRLRGAVSVYHQEFDNYPYRSPSGVSYVDYQLIPGTTTLAPPTLGRPFNFVAAVPAEVNGAEVEVNFAASSSWDIAASAAYADGEIQDGFIPCNDYNPRDGVPDSAGLPPDFNAGTILATGSTISGCTVTQNSSTAPKWSGSLNTEYRMPISPAFDGFARGQVSIYGSSDNDPVNAVDDYDGYELLNVYIGLRDPDGVWEVSLYGKNVTETERILQLSSSTMTGGLNGGTPPSPTNYYGGSPTTGLVMTAPREFGLNLRYSFGSR